MTTALRDELAGAIPETYEAELTFFLGMHLRGDWGDLDAEDWASNDSAQKGEPTDDPARKFYGRILSSYRLSNGTRLWIITEADRSVTTLLRPEDY